MAFYLAIDVCQIWRVEVSAMRTIAMKTKTVTHPETTEEVTFAQYVGRRIRQRRNELGWTMDELIANADISKTFLSEVECGKRNIGFMKLCGVARSLGRPTDWFAKGWFDE